MMAELTRQQKVKVLKDYFQLSNALFEAWEKRGFSHPPPTSPKFPECCIDLKCEAKTRAGTPCKNSGTDYANGRCKYHGGASTGPKTKEGKKRTSVASPLNLRISSRPIPDEISLYLTV